MKWIYLTVTLISIAMVGHFLVVKSRAKTEELKSAAGWKSWLFIFMGLTHLIRTIVSFGWL